MEFGSVSSPQNDQRKLHDIESDDNWFEDGLDDSFDMSEMSRELEKRCNHFHTIGYRDGLIAGKEASVQEGFNAGFKQSVLVGYRFGLVRGITSALTSLPELVKDKLTGTMDSMSRLDKLNKSIQLISTNNALKIFHDSILLNNSQQSHFHSEDSYSASILRGDDTGYDQLGKFSHDLESLLEELPAIKLHSEIQQESTGEKQHIL